MGGRTKRLIAAGGAAAAALVGSTVVPSDLVPDAGAAPLPMTVTRTERTRTVVNGTGGSRATIGFFVRTDSPCSFRRVLRVEGRVGYNGITSGLTRRQGSGTTPSGTYTMTQVFGNSPRPATAMPYHRVQPGDWWVQDQNSRFYNELRNTSRGGFLARTAAGERLIDYQSQYAHSVVINFNRAPDRRVIGRGSGIFLHVNGSGATAGCVSMTKRDLRTLLSYLRPGDRITITD